MPTRPEKQNDKALTATGKLKNAYKEAPSLVLPIDYQKSEEPLDDIEKITPLILHHAHMRMQTFFILLAAYHNSKKVIVLEETKGQKGRGSKVNQTNACHSALISSFTDQAGSIPMKLRSGKVKQSPRICGNKDTHFVNNVLDATIELPISVNNLDSSIEGKYSKPSLLRQTALMILNACSQGQHEPMQAMALFLLELKKEFLRHEEKYTKTETKTSSVAARQRVFTLQAEEAFKGVCTFGEDTSEAVLTEEYRELMGYYLRPDVITALK